MAETAEGFQSLSLEDEDDTAKLSASGDNVSVLTVAEAVFEEWYVQIGIVEPLVVFHEWCSKHSL